MAEKRTAEEIRAARARYEAQDPPICETCGRSGALRRLSDDEYGPYSVWTYRHTKTCERAKDERARKARVTKRLRQVW